MAWIRIAIATVASGVASSMTDWLFMGDWVYKRYDEHPEIWRHHKGEGEMKAILWATPLPFLTCSVFVFVCSRLNFYSYSCTLKLALAMWLIGPLPLTVANALFIKLTPAHAALHALGWLVKLTLAGLATVLILA